MGPGERDAPAAKRLKTDEASRTSGLGPGSPAAGATTTPPGFRLRSLKAMMRWPFPDEPQEIRVQLVDATGQEQYNKEVDLYVNLVERTKSGAELDQSRLLNIDRAATQLDSAGCARFVFSIRPAAEALEPGVKAPLTDYHIIIRATSRTADVPGVQTMVSPAIHVVHRRLEVAPENSEIPDTWFKDRGGKRNVIKVGFKLRDASGQIIADRLVPCTARLCYESGELVPSQKILNVRPESSLMLNAPEKEGRVQRRGSNSSRSSLSPRSQGAGVAGMAPVGGCVMVRIDEVSKNHKGQAFLIEVGPDLAAAPENADIGCLRTSPVAVRSKQNASRPSRNGRNLVDALPTFPGTAHALARLQPQMGGAGSADSFLLFKNMYNAGHLGNVPLSQINAASSFEQQQRALQQQSQITRQVSAPVPGHSPPPGTPQSNALLGLSRPNPKAQAALLAIAAWARAVPQLASIQWKHCGMDEAGEPLHYIPGNPNPLTDKLIRGYMESVQVHLVTLAEALHMPQIHMASPSPPAGPAAAPAQGLGAPLYAVVSSDGHRVVPGPSQYTPASAAVGFPPVSAGMGHLQMPEPPPAALRRSAFRDSSAGPMRASADQEAGMHRGTEPPMDRSNSLFSDQLDGEMAGSPGGAGIARPASDDATHPGDRTREAPRDHTVGMERGFSSDRLLSSGLQPLPHPPAELERAGSGLLREMRDPSAHPTGLERNFSSLIRDHPTALERSGSSLLRDVQNHPVGLGRRNSSGLSAISSDVLTMAPVPLAMAAHAFERQGSSMDSFLGEFVSEPLGARSGPTSRARTVKRVHYVFDESYVPIMDPPHHRVCLPALDVECNLMGFIQVIAGRRATEWTLEPWESYRKMSHTHVDYLGRVCMRHREEKHASLVVVQDEDSITLLVGSALSRERTQTHGVAVDPADGLQ